MTAAGKPEASSARSPGAGEAPNPGGPSPRPGPPAIPPERASAARGRAPGPPEPSATSEATVPSVRGGGAGTDSFCDDGGSIAGGALSSAATFAGPTSATFGAVAVAVPSGGAGAVASPGFWSSFFPSLVSVAGAGLAFARAV